MLRRLFNCFFKLRNTFILSWVYSNYRHTQFSFQCSNINLNSFSLRHVHHRQGNHHRHFQINDLGTEKKISFQAACIGNSYYHICLYFFILVQQHFITYPLILPPGIKAICSRQINYFCIDRVG